MAKSILIVNDSKEHLEMMQVLLEEEGYTVHLHSARMKNVEQVKEIKPDLLIIDQPIGSADNTGWEFIQKMKVDRETANTPIIMCTSAIAMVKELTEQLKGKNVRVVLKPFDIDDLLNEVKEALA